MSPGSPGRLYRQAREIEVREPVRVEAVACANKQVPNCDTAVFGNLIDLVVVKKT